MRRAFTIILALLFLASCSKKEPSVPVSYNECGKVTFRLGSGGITKSTFCDALGDNVDDVCLMVFAPSGVLYSAVYASLGDEVEMSLPTGAGGFRVVAVANPSDPDIMEHCLTYDMLLANSGYLEDGFNYEDSRIKMISNTPSVTFESGQVFNIKLHRLVAMVGIGNIRFRPVEAYSNYNLMVQNAFLVNVNRAYDYSEKWNSYAWCNKMDRTPDDELDAYLFNDISISLEAGSDQDVNASLYCCPNLTSADSHAAIWSPRHTRLVIEADFIDPENEESVAKYYYPIDVCAYSSGGLKANVAYNISCLTITGPGALSPEGELVPLDLAVELEIDSWTDGSIQNVTI